jgi:hypothetical protein
MTKHDLLLALASLPDDAVLYVAGAGVLTRVSVFDSAHVVLSDENGLGISIFDPKCYVQPVSETLAEIFQARKAKASPLPSAN